MTRSKQSGLKREKERNKQKKKREKEARKIERQSSKPFPTGDTPVNSFTPPAEVKKEEARPVALVEAKPTKGQGKVSYFNEQKKYGFIKDSITKGTIFFESDSLSAPVKVNDLLFYTVFKGPKGATARNITKDAAA